MQGIGRGRVGVEDARRTELPGRGLAFNGVIRLEEKIIIIEPAPGQLLITARGTGRNGNDMQVIPEANRVPRPFKLLDEISPGVAGINAQRHPSWLLQREPDTNGARLRTAQHRARKDERQVQESLG